MALLYNNSKQQYVRNYIIRENKVVLASNNDSMPSELSRFFLWCNGKRGFWGKTTNFVGIFSHIQYEVWKMLSFKNEEVLFSLRLQVAMKQYWYSSSSNETINWKEGCKVTSLGLLRPTPPQSHYSLQELGVAFFPLSVSSLPRFTKMSGKLQV